MKTIAIINQKGGVGKSTTASAVGAGLKNAGYRVLRIDLDPQGNLSYLMGSDNSYNGAWELLTGHATIDEAIQETQQGDLIAASQELTGAEIALHGELGKEYRLKEAIETISQKYDFCIIDTPPALGILLINALTAADGCIIPAQADFLSLNGIGQLYRTIEAVRKYCNRNLAIYGIVLTRYNPRAVVTKEVVGMMDDVAAKLNTRVYESKIRECVTIKEAQAIQQAIFDYGPKSNAAKDYQALVDEIQKELGRDK